MMLKENNNTDMIIQFIEKYVGGFSAPITVYSIEKDVWSRKKNKYVDGVEYTTENSYLGIAGEDYVSDIKYLGTHKISKDIFAELYREVTDYSDFRYEISKNDLKRFTEVVDNRLVVNIPFDAYETKSGNWKFSDWKDFCAFSEDSWYDPDGEYELQIAYTFAINNKVVDAADLQILLNN